MRQDKRGLRNYILDPNEKGESESWFLGHPHVSREVHVYIYIYIYLCIYIYMEVVLNKSSQEPPFRKFFANLSPPFAVPFRVAFSKIKNSYQESNIKQTRSNQNVIVICCFFSLGPISGMAKCSPFWAGHGSSGYVFRASFARLSRTFRSKS